MYLAILWLIRSYIIGGKKIYRKGMSKTAVTKTSTVIRIANIDIVIVEIIYVGNDGKDYQCQLNLRK